MSVNGRRRVVITGMGAVTPLGNDVETSWQNLVSGQSGAGPITQFDTTDYYVKFACELKDFDPTVWIDRKAARRLERERKESGKDQDKAGTLLSTAETTASVTSS